MKQMLTSKLAKDNKVSEYVCSKTLTLNAKAGTDKGTGL
jgi:hypothetical protein